MSHIFCTRLYPAVIGLFGDLNSQIALRFLMKYPQQDQMRSLREKTFGNWLKKHHYTCPQRIGAMFQMLRKPALTVQKHLQEAKASLIQHLARTVGMLNQEINAYDQRIHELFQTLPEAQWASSLPGAGKALAPALLACLGRDPQRFDDVNAARAFMGTAPVTKASGKSRSVYFRRGCWKFARRTLQLFAETSRHQSGWAQAFYEKQRDSGHHHHEALRALAHKWVSILLAMKRTGSCYQEYIFVNSQKRYLLNKPLNVMLN